MTVMLSCIAEIRIEMSLLEVGVQLMILPSTYNFFPYSECHPMLVFRVFSAVPGLVSLIRGSFSKLCPSDLGKAQDVPSHHHHHHHHHHHQSLNREGR